jgi:NADH:ubiquinone oxidoreductase subunit B-like Fe-S oxidoreductase
MLLLFPPFCVIAIGNVKSISFRASLLCFDCRWSVWFGTACCKVETAEHGGRISMG